jgi:hypothetical protein
MAHTGDIRDTNNDGIPALARMLYHNYQTAGLPFVDKNN